MPYYTALGCTILYYTMPRAALPGARPGPAAARLRQGFEGRELPKVQSCLGRPGVSAPGSSTEILSTHGRGRGQDAGAVALASNTNKQTCTTTQHKSTTIPTHATILAWITTQTIDNEQYMICLKLLKVFDIKVLKVKMDISGP